MAKNKKIEVQGIAISIANLNKEDYISLTDLARHKDAKRSDYILQNWMRTRNTIEYLGLWESLNNPNFNSIEFDGFKNEAGSNSFSLTPKRWIESINAMLIHQGVEQSDRLIQLNTIAITQMKSLVNSKGIKKLK